MDYGVGEPQVGKLEAMLDELKRNIRKAKGEAMMEDQLKRDVRKAKAEAKLEDQSKPDPGKAKA